MLQKRLKDRQLILSSGSPRRQQFLKDLGLDFDIQLRNVEEVYPDHLKEAEVAEYLAELKADAFPDLNENEILITGDTIVCIDGKILGKPESAKEAKEMLQQLSGKTHQVISSVCLKSSTKKEVFHDCTTVHFKRLTSEEIEYYINNHQPFDKAGAYGIQEWIGQIGVTAIEGSYSTVMGMPIHLLYEKLVAF